MSLLFSLANRPSHKTNTPILQALVVVSLFFIALLAKIKVLSPDLGQYLYPIGYKDVFTSLFLYSAPILFLLYCVVSRGKDIKFRLFDLLFGLIVLMHLVSFFMTNRGFQPVNPMLIDLSAYFLYLLMRNIHSRWMKRHTLFLLVLPVIPLSAEAGHAVIQLISGQLKPTGAFYNYNFLGMLLAMGLPVCVSQILTRINGRLYRLFFLFVSIFLFYLILRTTSRTAVCGVILSLSAALIIYYWPLLKNFWNQSDFRVRIPAGILFMASACALSYWVYSLRPLSVLGRGVLAKIGLFIFAGNPLTGIGFGEITPRLAEFQGRYFALGYGSPAERMLAGNPGVVTSEYLERSIENGIAGLLLYIPFWILLIWMAFHLIKDSAHESSPKLSGKQSLSTLGRLACRLVAGENSDMTRFSAGVVLILFLVMSIPYSPYRIMPIYIYFVYVLGLAVSLYESGRNSPTPPAEAENDELR